MKFYMYHERTKENILLSRRTGSRVG